jgi:hypothetical protein
MRILLETTALTVLIELHLPGFILQVLKEGFTMQTPTWTRFFCLFLAAVSSAQPANHDLKLTIRHTFGTLSFDTTEYYSGKNTRSEMQLMSGEIEGHHRAIIRKRGIDGIQVYDLDLDAKEYVSYQTDLQGRVPGSRSWTVKPSGKTLLINIESVDTGERKEMFGLQARHIITREKRIGGPENCYGGNSESEMDGWYIDYDVFPNLHRPVKSTVLVTHLAAASAGKNQHCTDKIEVHRSGPAPGYPLQLKTTLTSHFTHDDGRSESYTTTSETDVVAFSKAPLDLGLFQVPAGFEKIDKIVDPTQQPWRMQAMTYWQRLKIEFHDLFH